MSEVRVGLASMIKFECREMDCEYSVTLNSSEIINGNNNLYDVNRRFPLAIFAIGKNRAQGHRFLSNMNMPPAQCATIWNRHKTRICQATKQVAAGSVTTAVQEARLSKQPAANPNDVVDLTVSCDGSWQRRGFSSKNGVVTVMSVNTNSASKVLDTQTMSNYCNSCSINKKRKGDVDFQQWKHDLHVNCEANHEGSAGSMEPAGITSIFRRSVALHSVRYTKYLGDGDCKSYKTVAEAQPPVYPGAQISKLECNGHVQKRMGKRLSDVVTQNKDKIFDVGGGKTTKGIGGIRKLTKQAIKRIQGHYGAAIRKNVGDVDGMYQAIWAIFNHRNRDHRNCGDWCPSKTGNGDPNKNALPSFVCEAIRPVFVILSDRTLLEKCAHGGTQNSNESFHNLIWERCPKTQFVGHNRLAIAVYDATISFNDGECGRLNIFEGLGMTPGFWAITGFSEIDGKRVDNAYVAGCKAVIRHRRAARRPDNDNYQAGAF